MKQQRRRLKTQLKFIKGIFRAICRKNVDDKEGWELNLSSDLNVHAWLNRQKKKRGSAIEFHTHTQPRILTTSFKSSHFLLRWFCVRFELFAKGIFHIHITKAVVLVLGRPSWCPLSLFSTFGHFFQ